MHTHGWDHLGYQSARSGNDIPLHRPGRDRTAEALEWISAGEHFDLVILDMQMPEVDGLEATRLIQSRLGDEQRPQIIAVTANAMQGDRELCVEAGMEGYLSKPIDLKALDRVLAGCAVRDQLHDGDVQRTEPDNGVPSPVLDMAAIEALRELVGDGEPELLVSSSTTS